MNLSRIFTLLTLLAMLIIQGCGSQLPPNEVAQNFWDAVVANDAEKVQQLLASNTLEDAGLLSNSEKMLTAAEIGAVTTKDNRAEAETTLIGMSNGKETRLPVTTYMVLEEDEWKVHGQQSVNALVSTSMNMMMNDITGNLSGFSQAIGDSLSGGLQEFISAFNKEAPNIQKELEKLSDEEKTREIGRKLGKLFSDGLSDVMGELSKGLDELSTELDTVTQEGSKSE